MDKIKFNFDSFFKLAKLAFNRGFENPHLTSNFLKYVKTHPSQCFASLSKMRSEFGKDKSLFEAWFVRVVDVEPDKMLTMTLTLLYINPLDAEMEMSPAQLKSVKDTNRELKMDALRYQHFMLNSTEFETPTRDKVLNFILPELVDTLVELDGFDVEDVYKFCREVLEHGIDGHLVAAMLNQTSRIEDLNQLKELYVSNEEVLGAGEIVSALLINYQSSNDIYYDIAQIFKLSKMSKRKFRAQTILSFYNQFEKFADEYDLSVDIDGNKVDAAQTQNNIENMVSDYMIMVEKGLKLIK